MARCNRICIVCRGLSPKFLVRGPKKVNFHQNWTPKASEEFPKTCFYFLETKVTNLLASNFGSRLNRYSLRIKKFKILNFTNFCTLRRKERFSKLSFRGLFYTFLVTMVSFLHLKLPKKSQKSLGGI